MMTANGESDVYNLKIGCKVDPAYCGFGFLSLPNRMSRNFIRSKPMLAHCTGRRHAYGVMLMLTLAVLLFRLRAGTTQATPYQGPTGLDNVHRIYMRCRWSPLDSDLSVCLRHFSVDFLL